MLPDDDNINNSDREDDYDDGERGVVFLYSDGKNRYSGGYILHMEYK